MYTHTHAYIYDTIRGVASSSVIVQVQGQMSLDTERERRERELLSPLLACLLLLWCAASLSLPLLKASSLSRFPLPSFHGLSLRSLGRGKEEEELAWIGLLPGGKEEKKEQICLLLPHERKEGKGDDPS